VHVAHVQKRSTKVRQNGYAIRAFRLSKGRRLSELAAKVGITPGSLANIEAERRSVSPATLARIAASLGVLIQAIERDRSAEPPDAEPAGVTEPKSGANPPGPVVTP
jgi:transcriptional regulator with XRE-family HTH domain